MRYTMDRSGIGGLMRRSPAIHNTLRRVAHERLALMRARAPRSKPGDGGDSGRAALARSGRVEDLGIKKVYRGEPRMTMAVVFHSEYAAINNARSGFMRVGLGRAVPNPPDLPGGGR